MPIDEPRTANLHLPTRKRLITVVASLLLAGFLATNLVSYSVSTAALKSAILENELPLTSSNIYSEIQADLLRPIMVSSLMAQDTFVKDWLLTGEQELGRITRYLEEIRVKYGVFTAFLVSERTHNYYHFSGVPQVVEEKDPEDVWYFRVRAMAAPYEINVDFDRAQANILTVFVNYRVTDDQGRFLAAAGVGLRLDSLAQILSRFSDDGRRNIYFLKPDGEIVARSRGAAVQSGNIRHSPGMSQIAERMLAGDQGYYEYTDQGETMLLTTRVAPEFGWIVVVEQKESDTLRALRLSLLTNLAIGTTIILVTSLAIGYAISRYQQRLEDLATQDRLTGLANRQVFDTMLDQALRQHRRSGRKTTLILFDIDHFKAINDRLGHLKGDEVIRRVAERAASVVREADLLCRWGGEELLVLAYDCDLIGGREIAEKLRHAISATPVSHDLTVTVSIGVAQIQLGDAADTVMARADAALYRAKHGGRDRVELEAAPTA